MALRPLPPGFDGNPKGNPKVRPISTPVLSKRKTVGPKGATYSTNHDFIEPDFGPKYAKGRPITPAPAPGQYFGALTAALTGASGGAPNASPVQMPRPKPSGGSPISQGAGSGGAFAAPVAEAPAAPPPITLESILAGLKMAEYKPQPIIDLYSSLSNAMLSAKNTQASDLEIQRDASRKMYDDSTTKIAAELQADRDKLANAGQGLGVDINASVLGKDWDQHALEAQSTREAYRNADDIYWNKTKQSQGDVFSMLDASSKLASTNAQAGLKNMVDTTNAGITADTDRQWTAYQVALAQAAAAALAGGGGSGGRGGGFRRRRGGGGGGSGGGNVYNTTAAGETSTLNNVGDEAIYQALLDSGDAEAAAAFLRINNLSMGTPQLSQTQKELDNANAAYESAFRKMTGQRGIFGAINTVRNAPKANTALKNKQTMERVLRATMPLGGNMGNPKTTATVSNKANQRTYIPNTPYKTTAKPQAKPKKPFGGMFG